MANPYFVQPGNNHFQGLMALSEGINQYGQQKRQDEETARVQQRFADAQKAMSEAYQSKDPDKIMQAAIEYPEIQKTAELMFGFTNEQSKQAAAETYRRILADPENALQYMDDGIQLTAERGGQPYSMIMDRVMLQNNPEAALKSIRAAYAGVDPKGYAAMFPQSGAGGGIGKYNPRDYTTESWNKFIQTGNPGVLSRYETSMQERLAADQGLTNAVAQSQAQIAGSKAGATEQGKSDVQLAMKPKIQAAVKQAEQEAKDKGETVSALTRAKAALPGLQEVSQKLKTLADVATYTIGGKAFDEVVKQLGFGSTEGATARAKMISIVDNQVLPLLRDTFGAAFTAAEGDRLRDTFIDPDASPEQKKATLDAFIEQKVRNIETQERELGQAKSPESGTIGRFKVRAK